MLGSFLKIFCKRKLFLGVSSVEFFHTTSGVQNHLFTSVEWVRVRRNLDFVHWIFLTIFPNDCFASLYSRLRDKLIFARGIVEYDWSVVRMNVFFHCIAIFLNHSLEMRHKDIAFLKAYQKRIKII
jgi:hypothetical protein